ncbi:MAG: hypothetical protein EBU90_04875 [Proteobacteria bacterium]|nr:hypothetical protein [Pseudomonadota bacterium]NBP13748.1 hypothetical protein [bacterium]
MSITGIDITGYLAGGLTTICMFPQLIQIILTDNSADDISLPTFFCLVLGQILWIVYGALIVDLRIIIANVVSCFLAISIIIIVVYKRRKSKCFIHYTNAE